MAGDVLSEKVHVPPVHSMVRDRLDALMMAAQERRLTLVIGPAGCGKSTLLARFTDTAAGAVAWFQADEADAEPGRLLRYLDASFAEVVPGFGSHHSVDALVADLEQFDGPLYLVIDDLHTLHGTEAEHMLGRLIRYFPRTGSVVAATRREPSIDLSRLRLDGGLLEIGADTMRFRTWEVERLFRDHYDAPLRPAELGELARRTGGWAAGLQLFHLATDGKSIEERRQMLDALATRSRVVRDYLTRNVLEGLAPELRSFLLETCVLTDVDPELCDDLRGERGSAPLLAELERRQLLVTARAGNAYRYHEVLRHHLQAMLLDDIGEAAIRARFGAAAELLEERGRIAQALVAHASAGDAHAVRRVLLDGAEMLADEPGDWIASLPPAIVSEDPWVSLAVARWLVRAGRPGEAADAYRGAERVFGSGAGAEICRRERSAVQVFTSHAATPVHGGERWVALTQRALRRSTRPAPPPRSAVDRLVAGIDLVLSGSIADGVASLERLRDENSPLVRSVAGLVAGLAPHWPPGAPPAPPEVISIVAQGDAVAGPWFGRVGAALGALTGMPAAIEAADEIAAAPWPEPWSAMLAAYAAATGRLHDTARHADARHSYQRAATLARDAGAPVMVVWSQAGEAMAAALAGDPDAGALATDAGSAARGSALPGAEAVAAAALGLVEPDRTPRAEALVDELGLELTAIGSTGDDRDADLGSPARPEPTIVLRTFGGLALHIGDDDVALDELKPRWRSVLALLALELGNPVHRDSISAALWPTSSESAGRRGLQVAVSALRTALDADGRLDVARRGEAYELRLPAGSWCDHRWATQRISEARASHRAGDLDGAAAGFTEVLDICGAELLPEEGNQEWILEHREHWRYVAADVAGELAEVHIEQQEWSAADHAAAAGLEIDRHRDSLWRQRLMALERAGDRAHAAQVRRMYDEVLVDLGVHPSPA